MSKRWMSALAACMIAASLCACTGMRGNVSDDPNGKINNYGNGAYDTNGTTGTVDGTGHDVYDTTDGTTVRPEERRADRNRTGENALDDLRRAAKDTGSAVKRAMR